VALTTAVATAAGLAGMLPGTPSAATGPRGSVELSYSCAFTPAAADPASDPAAEATPPAAVTEDATVTIQQRYPAVGTVGADIRPGALTVEVALGKDAAGAVLPAGATAAAATAALTARVTQGSSAADARWPGLRAASAPAADGLDLTFTGRAAVLSVTAPGTVRFDAGRLDLVVYAQTPPSDPPSASATPAPSGTDAAPDSADAGGTAPAGSLDGTLPAAAATVSGTVTAACTPKDGQATELGEVRVTGPASHVPGGSAAGTAAPTAPAGTPAGGSTGAAGPRGDRTRHGTITLAGPPHSGINDCPPAPTGDPDQGFLDSVPRPPGARFLPVALEDRLAECGFITGLSNVGKLHGAATVNALDEHPALTRVAQIGTWIGVQNGKIYIEFDSVADMDLPPAHSAFLTFGFMPTTAVMTMTQVAPLTLIIVGSTGFGYTTTTTVVGKLDLRLSDVEVNGTPLDVGPDCHTVRPLELHLTGIDRSVENGHDGTVAPSDYNEIEGGPLFQDQLTIPPFTGCSAHGDDVDALLTASISGPGNSLNFIQGGLCIPASRDASHCDPEIPYPTPPHR
jgi:hypothetical protein